MFVHPAAAAADVAQDKFTLEELTMPRLASSLLTRSMRRQSSAFEMPSKIPQQATNVRRQSSAFELAALTKLRENNFNRGVTTRASLKQRNSSVKDLVQKLEVTKPAAAAATADEIQQPRYNRMSISTSALPSSVQGQDFKLPSPPKETPVKQPSVHEVTSHKY